MGQKDESDLSHMGSMYSRRYSGQKDESDLSHMGSMYSRRYSGPGGPDSGTLVSRNTFQS